MATAKQRAAARSNVKKAQAGARRKQTLKNLPSQTRTALGKESAAVRRGDAPTRKELEAEARRLGIQGRSKMGKAELKRAVSRARRARLRRRAGGHRMLPAVCALRRFVLLAVLAGTAVLGISVPAESA